MKKMFQQTYFRSVLWILIVSALLFEFPLQGCGGGGGSSSPPASIPAPVASLMTVSAPSADGATSVTGAAGTVNSGATVTAANITQGGTVQKLENLFIRKAFAQVVQATALADDTGAFTLTLDAHSGDQLGIRQHVGTRQSTVTDLTVP